MFLKVCVAVTMLNFLVFGVICYIHVRRGDTRKEELEQMEKHLLVSGLVFLSVTTILWLFGSLAYHLVKFWEGLLLSTSTVFSVSLICSSFQDLLADFFYRRSLRKVIR